MQLEAEARGNLASSLHLLCEDPQRALELRRDAVRLLRKAVRATYGFDKMQAKLLLAMILCNLGDVLKSPDADGGMAEAKACFRQALVIAEASNHAQLLQDVLLR